MAENDTIRDGFTLAALAAAAGRPASEIAAVAGVSERTIRRWNRKPAFVALVNRLREQMLGDAFGRLLATNADAVDALAGLLRSPLENIRLGAAGRLLELTLRTRHQVSVEGELRAKVEELESLVKEYFSNVGDAQANREDNPKTPPDGRAAEESGGNDAVEGGAD